MGDPPSEAARVRRAVEESVRLGTLCDELVTLVHRIARRRVNYQWCEDVAQTVLLGLLTRLPKIDLERNVYHYVCGAIVNTWKKWCRNRGRERRYLLREAGAILEGVPAVARSAARRQAWKTSKEAFGQKYY